MSEPLKKRGMVEIPLETMAKLLHLHEGLSVIGAEYKPEYETIQVFLSGEGLCPSTKRSQLRLYRLPDLMDVE